MKQSNQLLLCICCVGDRHAPASGSTWTDRPCSSLQTPEQNLPSRLGGLERVHDYIPWMLPLDEPSALHAEAPSSTKINSHVPQVRANLLVSFISILIFFGYDLIEDERLNSASSESFQEQPRNWLRPRTTINCGSPTS